MHQYLSNRHDGGAMLQFGVARADAELAVLAVHGRGQDPTFMQQTAQRFGASPARFYAPEAAGNSWYPQPFLEPLERNQPDLDEALHTIDLCLGHLAEVGFGPDRTVLWGFSQGACLLSHYVLSSPRRFAGIILFTGGYLGPGPRQAPEGEPLREVPAVLRSIDRDPWVPRSRVEDTAALLTHAGAGVDLRIDPGTEHIITDEACAATTRLLGDVSALRKE
ncbi:phospholipase/carboxylesterase [Halopolyspora algeriensis]|uniref:Phospholipase/carboxylesterase n=1 Tax=Halopolyspora algeriensis TaxID=1500506 RepID=A0A368VUE3_9ACTN|nr:phospholipase [Halopolyspora algeriensis]RCW45726.1 phospholipase/carboxylesterase [Halopolyspora algeriensis]TQM54110.1 phospholipase/carboxylesterase [Halopolyspora algeriensis]